MLEKINFREGRSKVEIKNNLEKSDFLESKKNIRKQGITLIALVVTIVVLLILASVSITVVFGDNGILQLAKEAGEKTNKAEDNDLRQMAMAEAAMHLENSEYIDKNGDKAIIPAGFAVSKVEGENIIDDGLVIIDSKGNEFVWIPCKAIDYENANFDSSWNNQFYIGENADWTDSQMEIGKSSLNNLEKKQENLESNERAIGFYVARYEAGIPDDALSFYASKDGDSYKLKDEKDTTNYIPVSKKGVQAWNCISQQNAVEISKAMYANNTAVDSYLIDSHAWNYICKAILTKKVGNDIIENSTRWGNYSNNTLTKYEDLEVLYALHEINYENWEWVQYAEGESTAGTGAKYHKGLIPKEAINSRNKSGISKCIELETGASEDFKVYNIYDMAGNMWEWTTEMGTNTLNIEDRVCYRGGGFECSGTSNTVVRVNCSAGVGRSYANVAIGFRVVLYLK